MPSGKVNANNVLFYIADVAVGCLTDVRNTITNEQIDVTCKDNNGAESNLPGQQKSGITITGIVKMDVATAFPLIIQRAKDKASFVWKMSTEVVGDYRTTDSGFISDFDWGGGFNEGATFTATIVPSETSTGITVEAVPV